MKKRKKSLNVFLFGALCLMPSMISSVAFAETSTEEGLEQSQQTSWVQSDEQTATGNLDQEEQIGESLTLDEAEQLPNSVYATNRQVTAADLTVQGTNRYDFAYRVLELMNAERRKNNVSPLMMDRTLQEAAMERSAELNIDFDHYRPNGEIYSTIFKKYNYVPTGYGGENIAGGQSSPESVFNSWMSSPGHKKNMLNSNYKSVGIGSFTQGSLLFWTQIFSGKQVTDFKRVDTQQAKYTVGTDITNQIVINYINPWTMNSGDTQEFFLSIQNKGWPNIVARISNESVNWSVSDTTIATINSSGLLTAKKAGTTTFKGTVKTNPKWTINHTVTVQKKVGPPTLTAKDITRIAGDSFNAMKDVAFEAFDYEGNNLKTKVVVTANNVNMKKPGTYKVTFSVTDKGKRTTTKTINVTVVAGKPELQVKNISVVAGTVFDPKAAVVSATDKLDGDLKNKVTASAFNVSKEGTYEVTYTVKNTNNQSTSKKATVTVVASAPSLNVRNLTIQLNSSFNYKEAIVSAADKVDGDLKSKVVITKNTVDPNKIGMYQVEYTVTNSHLKTTKKTITVTVVKEAPTVSYQTHVQNQGWQDYKKNGQMAGTKGKSLRLEALKIKLTNQPDDSDIIYSTHVQNIGWQDEVKNNAVSGTSGKSYRLEAIKIKLTGQIAQQYDVYYRVHAQNFGWLDWAKNGTVAGTEGFAYRLEGIEIQLVEKGQDAPGAVAIPFKLNTRIMYSTHVQNIGWQKYMSNGQTAGTQGKSYRLEGLKVKLKNLPLPGGIEYSTHIQNKGWQDFVANDQLSGTSGQKLRLEAVKINLTGAILYQYEVYYRVHAQNFGWLGWAKHGEPAGTEKYGYRLEAIEIQLVKRGDQAPVSTVPAFRKK